MTTLFPYGVPHGRHIDDGGRLIISHPELCGRPLNEYEFDTRFRCGAWECSIWTENYEADMDKTPAKELVARRKGLRSGLAALERAMLDVWEWQALVPRASED